MPKSKEIKACFNHVLNKKKLTSKEDIAVFYSGLTKKQQMVVSMHGLLLIKQAANSSPKKMLGAIDKAAVKL